MPCIFFIGPRIVVLFIYFCLPVIQGQFGVWNQYHSDSEFGNYKKAAVAAESKPCAAVGRKILERKGSAVDAAIATLICSGVNHPQSSGIGGGFHMIYYNRTQQKAYFIDARETAPRKATENMFEGDKEKATHGGLTIAVPGEIAGYEKAHQRFGRLPWKDLFTPTIKICREGIVVSENLAKNIAKMKKNLMKYQHIRNLFLKNGRDPYEEGERIKMPKLARTLQIIAERGKNALYRGGKLHKGFLRDLKAAGSIIDRIDMRNYSPRFRQPTKVTLHNAITLFTSTIPGSGPLLAFMMAVLDGYSDLDSEVTQNKTMTIIALHRIVETFKFAYSYRSQLEDDDTPEMKELLKLLKNEAFAKHIRSLINDRRTYDDPEHYGTAEGVSLLESGTCHISVLAPDGDAVAVTSTINSPFGSLILSPSTGIILNNEMNDFSLPNITNIYGVEPSKSNRIRSGKRPLSSMVPSVLTDSIGNVQLVVGASGGSRITTSVLQIIARIMIFGEDIKESIDAPRLHHQLQPNTLFYERHFPKDIVRALKAFGHKVDVVDEYQSNAVGIHRFWISTYLANSDFRKGGACDGF